MAQTTFSIRWLGLAALLAGAPVHADDGAATDDLASVLAQPVYGSTRLAGASKYDQDAVDAPSMVYVRTGGEIRAQGYRTLAEVLDSLPGTHLRYDRLYSYTGVRGISRPGDYSSRLLLLIDGVRVNDAIYDSATGGGEFPIDVGLIDRVEYIPGPGSALYGSNAVMGVVNVITRSASQLPGLNALLDYGSGNDRKASLSWGGDMGPARLLLGLSSERSRGHRALYYPEYDAAETNHGVAERLDGERNDKLFAKARWGDFTWTTELSNRVKADPTGSYGVIYNTRNESIDRFALTDLSYARPIGQDQEIFARLGFGAYTYYGYGLYGDSAAPVPGETRSEARWASGELRHVWSGWSGHRVLVGAEFQNNFRQYLWSADLEPAPQILSNRELRSWRGALFVNDEWQLLPTVRLNLGLRSDRRLDGHYTTTPRLAALWSPSPQWTVKLQHGSAFREPNVSETHYSDNSQQLNAALKVESLRSDEATVLWRPAPGLDISASAYSLDIRDSITLATLPSGIEQYENSGHLRSRGFELEAAQVFASGMHARASWSRQHGTDRDTGEALGDSPRSLVKLMLTAPGPWAGARLGANVVRIGERQTLAGARLASCLRLNAQLTHAPEGQPWSLGIGVYNLAGTRCADPGGPEHLQDSIPQDGRRWRAQFGWAF
ncbi:MAG: TonB-dependent receptor [Burkholderiaceae bacterium]